MKTDWIALFKNDYTSQVFPEPVASPNILYWIKRAENGRMSPLTSSGNTLPLRSFEFFNGGLEPCEFISTTVNKWTCTGIVERSNDRLGSNCVCSILDPEQNPMEIILRGFFVREGGNHGLSPFLDEDHYFSCLILYFQLLSKFGNWETAFANLPVLHKQGTNFIPQCVFKYIFERNESLKQIKYQTLDKLNANSFAGRF